MQRPNQVKIKNILSAGVNLKDRFIPNLAELRRITDDLKRMGYRIVLTQGVYDMIHEGHAKYLEKALSYGDILVVGVDSDELTRLRKGPNRPIVPQKERLQMLAHLRHVSILTVREAKHGLGKLIETGSLSESKVEKTESGRWLIDDRCKKEAVNCDNFEYQEDAQGMFEYCGGPESDVHGLDGDDDGEVCEALPSNQ